MEREIEYGKAQVSVYRTYATPLIVTPIPESPCAGRDNVLFGALVDVRVLGKGFLAAYTEGDNRAVVATDTMKNFVYAMALDYDGATLEGFAAFLARRFLAAYPPMESLEVTVREQPFARVGEALFERARDDVSTARVRAERSGGATEIAQAESGREDLRLVKLSGSSFARFSRDIYTTLPETTDRPLFIHLDAHWRYADARAGIGELPERYVHPDQVRDLIRHTFDGFTSRSIQHLVNEMGERILARLPQLREVRLAAQNRTWETAAAAPGDGRVKVYTDPHGTFGNIGLVLRR